MQGCLSEGLFYVNSEEEIARISWGCSVTSPICHSTTAQLPPRFFFFFISALCEVLNFSADP